MTRVSTPPGDFGFLRAEAANVVRLIAIDGQERSAPAVGRFGGPSVRPRADFRLGRRLRVAARARCGPRWAALSWAVKLSFGLPVLSFNPARDKPFFI